MQDRIRQSRATTPPVVERRRRWLPATTRWRSTKGLACRGRDQEVAGTSGLPCLADLTVEPNHAAGEQAQRFGIDPVLDFKHPLGERIRRVVIAHSDRALHQDRAGIGLRGDEMHRRARYLYPRPERLAVRV